MEKWGPEVGGNLWRTTHDIRDEWSSMLDNVEQQVPTAPYASPGRWNDPDMLEIGNGHMTDDEYRAHMSLWALVAAPLLAGNDVRVMSDATKAILLNKEVIAIDQDPLGKQASPRKDGDLETWIKPLADGSVAVGVVNLGNAPSQAAVNSHDLQLGGNGDHGTRSLGTQGCPVQRRYICEHDLVARRFVAQSASQIAFVFYLLNRNYPSFASRQGSCRELQHGLGGALRSKTADLCLFFRTRLFRATYPDIVVCRLLNFAPGEFFACLCAGYPR